MRPFPGLGIRLLAAAFAAAVGLAPATAAAQDFELHPGYIDGTIEFGDSVDLSFGYAYAYAYDPSTGQNHNASTPLVIGADGNSATFHLTVESGESGLTYSVYTYSYTSGGSTATIYTPQLSAAVTEENTTSVAWSYPDFEFGSVDVGIEVTGAGTLQYGYVYFYSYDSGTGVTVNSNVYVPAGGAAVALVGPGEVQAYGNAYLDVGGSSSYYPLGYQYFTLASGGSVALDWSLDIDPVDPGSISGSISIDGEAVDVFYIYASGGTPPQSTYIQVMGGGSFTFDPTNPGTWYLNAYAYDATDDGGNTYYTWPYVSVTVAPGEDLSGVDFEIDPAFVEGDVVVGDLRDPSSSTVYVAAYSGDGAYTQHSRSLGAGNPGTTPYRMYVDPDRSWQFSSVGVTAYYYDGTNNASNSVSGVVPGASIPDLDADAVHERDLSVLDFTSATLTLHLTVAGGGTLSYPQVTANGYALDGDGNYAYSSYANGSNYGQVNVSEGTVTLTLAPGTYDITAQAQVNGSWVTFGILNDYVVEPGDDIEQDLDAPALSVSSPAPQAVFECHEDVTVSGVATDASGVASVTVNGVEVDVAEDGSFETVLEDLDAGTHAVEIVAVDTLGNTITLSRSFTVLECDDEEAPVVSASPSISCIWPPNHKMVPVTISGSASDESSLEAIAGFTITSNQADDTNGDGRSTLDCHGKDGHSSPAAFADSISIDADGNFSFVVKLRAERAGNGQDRVYTIAFTVADELGNETPVSVSVKVPHNQ